MTNPLFFQNAFVTSSRQSKNDMQAVKNDTQVKWGSKIRPFEIRNHSKSGHFEGWILNVWGFFASVVQIVIQTIRKPDIFVRFWMFEAFLGICGPNCGSNRKPDILSGFQTAFHNRTCPVFGSPLYITTAILWPAAPAVPPPPAIKMS